MRRLQQVAGLVRKLRQGSKSETMWIPLKKITICSDNKEALEDTKEFERYLREATNVLDVSYGAMKGQIRYKLKPDNKNIGLKYKSLASKIKTALEKVPSNVAENATNSVQVGIDNDQILDIDSSCYTIVMEVAGETNKSEKSQIDKDIMVIIDLEYTKEVDDRYRMRLFIKNVQDLRKETKLRPWNPIKIYHDTENVQCNSVLKNYYNDIVSELGYKIYSVSELGENEKQIAKKMCDLDGIKLNIVLVDDSK
jgi:hypothetical protein